MLSTHLTTASFCILISIQLPALIVRPLSGLPRTADTMLSVISTDTVMLRSQEILKTPAYNEIRMMNMFYIPDHRMHKVLLVIRNIHLWSYLA